jgi:hypothetical protein
MVRNCCGGNTTMPSIYSRALATVNADNSWDFKSWTADALVINLGTSACASRSARVLCGLGCFKRSAVRGGVSQGAPVKGRLSSGTRAKCRAAVRLRHRSRHRSPPSGLRCPRSTEPVLGRSPCHSPRPRTPHTTHNAPHTAHRRDERRRGSDRPQLPLHQHLHRPGAGRGGALRPRAAGLPRVRADERVVLQARDGRDRSRDRQGRQGALPRPGTAQDGAAVQVHKLTSPS